MIVNEVVKINDRLSLPFYGWCGVLNKTNFTYIFVLWLTFMCIKCLSKHNYFSTSILRVGFDTDECSLYSSSRR